MVKLIYKYKIKYKVKFMEMVRMKYPDRELIQNQGDH
jgi:hypothetical protein